MRATRSLSALRSLASWRRDALRAYQRRCVAAVVGHAATRVPYYRRLFAEAGLAPGEIHGLDDLVRLPISTRRSMQTVPAVDLVRRGSSPDRLLNHLSSGSTGEPFTTRRTRFEDRLLLAFRVRIFQAMGARLFDNWGTVRWVGRQARSIAMDRRVVPLRGRAVSCIAPADARLAALRGCRFDVIGGLAGSLLEVAELMTEEDRAAFRPRFVLTGGDSSTAQERDRLASAFSAPVYDLYGTNEFNATAWQCAVTGLYHVSDPTVVLEVVDEHGSPVPEGAEGEVVGTNLHAFAMPFIRYRLDDLAVRGPDPCPCGAPWSTLTRVVGRVSERFRLPSGERIHPYALQEAFMPYAQWLQGFQIIQESLGRVRLKLRPLAGRAPSGDDLERYAREVRRVLGADVEVVIDLVADLPRGGRGKALHYVCLVDAAPADSGG